MGANLSAHEGASFKPPGGIIYFLAARFRAVFPGLCARAFNYLVCGQLLAKKKWQRGNPFVSGRPDQPLLGGGEYSDGRKK